MPFRQPCFLSGRNPAAILLIGFEISDHIADGDKFVDVVVVNGNAEFVFAEHDQIGELNRFDAEVRRKFSLGSNVFFVNLKFFHQNGFHFFKH